MSTSMNNLHRFESKKLPLLGTYLIQVWIQAWNPAPWHNQLKMIQRSINRLNKIVHIKQQLYSTTATLWNCYIKLQMQLKVICLNFKPHCQSACSSSGEGREAPPFQRKNQGSILASSNDGRDVGVYVSLPEQKKKKVRATLGTALNAIFDNHKGGIMGFIHQFFQASTHNFNQHQEKENNYTQNE